MARFELCYIESMRNTSAVVFAMSLVAFGVYFFLHNSHKISSSKRTQYGFANLLDEDVATAPSSLSRNQAAVSAEHANGAQGTAPVQVVPLQVAEATQEAPSVDTATFSRHLKSCLGLPVSSDSSDDAVLNQSGLFSSIASLGETVLQSEDWSEKDILTSEGKIKRIRLEVNLQEEENLGLQKLRYSEVLANGQVKDIPLNQDQSVEPDKNLLASLESEGKVMHESKKERAYFTGGEEVIYGTVDGKIKNVEIHRFDITMSCQGANCSCTSNQAQFDDGNRPLVPPTAEVNPVDDKSKFRAKAEFQQSQIPSANNIKK